MFGSQSPVVSSLLVELEQEVAQVRGWSLMSVCPGGCAPGGRWSPAPAACYCIAGQRSKVAGRTWLLIERYRWNRTEGTDGLETDRQNDRQINKTLA